MKETTQNEPVFASFSNLPWSKRPFSDKALWVASRTLILVGAVVAIGAGMTMYQDFKCAQNEACLNGQAVQAKEEFMRTRGLEIAHEFAEAEKESGPSGLLPDHPEILPGTIKINPFLRYPKPHQ